MNAYETAGCAGSLLDAAETASFLQRRCCMQAQPGSTRCDKRPVLINSPVNDQQLVPAGTFHPVCPDR